MYSDDPPQKGNKVDERAVKFQPCESLIKEAFELLDLFERMGSPDPVQSAASDLFCRFGLTWGEAKATAEAVKRGDEHES